MKLYKVDKVWVIMDATKVFVASKNFTIFDGEGKRIASGVKLRDFCKSIGVVAERGSSLSEMQATWIYRLLRVLEKEEVSVATEAVATVDEEKQEFESLLLELCETHNWELATSGGEYIITAPEGQVLTENYNFLPSQDTVADRWFTAVVQWEASRAAARRLKEMECQAQASLTTVSSGSSLQPRGQ